MKIKLFCGAVFAAILSFGFAQPTSAASAPLASPMSHLATFAADGNDESGALVVGHNLFLFGNNVTTNENINGLTFLFGNQLEMKGSSDYSFASGNIIEYSGETDHDLFIAGNNITLNPEANIGRDVFIAGNNLTVKSDIPGDLSVAASRVILHNVYIAGDVNLSVGELIFEGSVQIGGDIIVNQNANISGLSNVTYAEMEKYEVEVHNPTALEILIGKIISVLGLFITFAVLLALFPGINKRVEREISSAQLLKDLVVGCCTFIIMPVVIFFLCISFFAAPLGIILLVAYLIMIYLSQAFTGFWLGKLILETGFHWKGNHFLEALVGITIVIALNSLPYFSGFTWLLSALLGFGLIMQCINPRCKRQDTSVSGQTYYKAQDNKTTTNNHEEVSASTKKSESDLKSDSIDSTKPTTKSESTSSSNDKSNISEKSKSSQTSKPAKSAKTSSNNNNNSIDKSNDIVIEKED